MTNQTVTLENLETKTTKELLAFYNAHNVDAPVAKFADLKTARRRVTAVLESLAIIDAQGGDHEDGVIVEPAAPAAPVHKTRASRKVVAAPETDINAGKADDEISEADARAELELLKLAATTGKTKVGAKSGLTLSQAIAASWNDPLVAQKRMTRHGVSVTVNGKSGEFKSARSAFEQLGLPTSKCIRFRMALKAAGEAIFEHDGQQYHFAIVELSGE